MGLRNIFKRKSVKEKPAPVKATPLPYAHNSNTNNVQSSNQALPCGWTYQNRDFIKPIEKEYSRLLSLWTASISKSPNELYTALSNFVTYMETVKNTCKGKDKNFEIWFEEILTAKGYLEKRKNELLDLERNLVSLQTQYEQKQLLLPTLDQDLFAYLSNNDDILQTDVYKHFDPALKEEIQSRLYFWARDGKIIRIKKGRTYTISTNKNEG